jgi:hypothetical protein
MGKTAIIATLRGTREGPTSRLQSEANAARPILIVDDLPENREILTSLLEPRLTC